MKRLGDDVDALYYILQIGDEFKPGDEFYDAELDKWLPINGGLTGAGFSGNDPDVWDDEIYAPVRRRNPNRLRGRLVLITSRGFSWVYKIVDIPYGATIEQFTKDWSQVESDAEIVSGWSHAMMCAGMQEKGWVLRSEDSVKVSHSS